MKARYLGLVAAAALVTSSLATAGTYNLVVDKTTVNITGDERPAMAINGSIPAPALRWREGEEVMINVTNKLDEDTSIHWHGIILPNDQDGVPGMTFAGIKPGETFTYRFTVRQSGTYWYHSHSGMQEAVGMYGPLIIEPADPEPYRYDREYTVMLSDWLDENPHRVMANLKKSPGYYNYNKRTVVDLFRDLASAESKSDVIKDRLAWAQMRMDPTDLADISGFTFLTNGKTPEQNWTGVFAPGEKVRLRLINGSAMSYYDFRIPGLKMTVVQADGQDVEPVVVDEVRIAVGETYDVIVEPDNRAYTLFAEAFDRSGYARGTLAPHQGMSAEIPELRERPLLTMADMSHGDHAGMNDHAAMGHGAKAKAPAANMKVSAESAHAGHGSMAAPSDMQGSHGGHAEHDAGGNGHAAPADEGDHGGHGGPEKPQHTPDGDHGSHMNHGAMHAMHGRQMAHGQMGDAAGSAPTDAHAGHGGQGESAAAADMMSDHSQHMAGMRGRHGADHGSMRGTPVANQARELPPTVSAPTRPGYGNSEPAVGRSLTYADLRAAYPKPDYREPDREVLIRLTGNMERFIWSINDKKFSEAKPIQLKLGERVRFKFVNETMMNHPMHLHGMWMEPVNGQEEKSPRKHIVNIPPGQTYYVDVNVAAAGNWAFHCHLMYHMDGGMFRMITVAEAK